MTDTGPGMPLASCCHTNPGLYFVALCCRNLNADAKARPLPVPRMRNACARSMKAKFEISRSLRTAGFPRMPAKTSCY